MRIEYELSLWIDYPSSDGIKEEKTEILAHSKEHFQGRAQNIKLQKEYTGKHTLTFDMPVKYIDLLTGDFVINPLISKIPDKSKLKLWRNELWWNPFANKKGVDDMGATQYEGGWQQGRWYDFIVNSHIEKRSKKELMYSFTCDSLFMNELSRNGYSLEFVADTDIMASNGMGTAHDLAERIVENTDWQYIKTETFPDYKEEFNSITGETVKTPVATDQIEFMKGLQRYGYCYDLEITDSAQQENYLEEIERQLKEKNLDAYLKRNINYGFENNKFWWTPKIGDAKKTYVYNHQQTKGTINLAKMIMNLDSGGMILSGNKATGATSFSEGMNQWESLNGTIELAADGDIANPNSYKTFMNVIPDANGMAAILYKGYQTTSIPIGKLFAVKVAIYSDDLHDQELFFEVWEKPENNDYSDLSYRKLTIPLKELNGNNNAFADTYYFASPTFISNPHFIIRTEGIKAASSVTGWRNNRLNCIYIYELNGYDTQLNNYLKESYGLSGSNYGLISDLLSSGAKLPSGYSIVNGNLNDATINGKEANIWLGFTKTSSEGYASNNDAFLIEFNYMGESIDVYLPLTSTTNLPSGITASKKSSYKTDKRRAINGSKSNRYSLLETVSKTFSCFTRFMVEHESDGRIKLNNGKPQKYFTFVSELGRKQLNGFIYGTNLEGVERKVDASQLITKMHVESIENKYTENNMVTIQDSIYNPLGMTFLYNFSYYLQMGLLDKKGFLADYQEMNNYIAARTKVGLAEAKRYSQLLEQLNYYENNKYVTELSMSTLASMANDSLSKIFWPRFAEHNITDANYRSFPNLDITKMKDYVSTELPDITDYNNSTYATYYQGYEEDESGYVKIVDWNPDLKPVPKKYHTLMDLARFIFGRFEGEKAEGKQDFWGGGLPPETIYNELSIVFNYQNRWMIKKENIEAYNKILHELQQKVDEYNKESLKRNTEIQNKIAWFEKRYSTFIIEGTWNGKDYIDSNSFYLDATRAFADGCMPKVTYSANVLDLTRVCNPYNPEDTEWGNDFICDIGDTTFIKDPELFGDTEQLMMVASIGSYIDSDKSDDIALRNYETRFEELFQQVATTITTLQLNENTWGKAANFMADGTIDETILQKSFNQNKNIAISSANNTVKQDNTGITVQDEKTGEVLRLIGGGIFLSQDNGSTYTTGLTAKGINASLITSGQLDTSKIVIRSEENPLLTLDSAGLTAYTLAYEGQFVRFDQYGLYMGEQINYFPNNWNSVLNDPVAYIQQNSTVSLTKKGLLLNSLTSTGYLKLNTETSTLEICNYSDPRTETGGNNIYVGKHNDEYGFFMEENKDPYHYSPQPRIKIGKMQYPISNTNQYGLEIYEGAFAIYGSAQDGGYKKLLWTELEDGSIALKIAGSFSATTGDIGGWKIGEDQLYYVNSINNSKFSIGPLIKGIALQGSIKNSKGEYEPFFEVFTDGTLTAKKGNIGNWTITDYTLHTDYTNGGINYRTGIQAYSASGGEVLPDSAAFFAGYKRDTTGVPANSTFCVQQNGHMICRSAEIKGDVSIQGKLDVGSYINDLKIISYKDSQNNATSTIIGFPESQNTLSYHNMGCFIQFDDHGAIRIRSTQYGYENPAIVYPTIQMGGPLNNAILLGKWELEGTLKTSSAGTITSDINKKHEIAALSPQYSNFFDNLRPVTYKYNDGTSDRLHTGFIAQEVQEALNKANINSKDFAGLVIFDRDTENELWTLRYSEFIALNTAEIQKLKTRVTELEFKLKTLTSL